MIKNRKKKNTLTEVCGKSIETRVIDGKLVVLSVDCKPLNKANRYQAIKLSNGEFYAVVLTPNLTRNVAYFVVCLMAGTETQRDNLLAGLSA